MAQFERRLKTGYFVLEWLNAYAITLFFSYFFFYMQLDFGFGNRENLLLSAVVGFIYIFGAWQGGKVAQKRGYFFSLWIAFATMLLALAAGSQLPSAVSQCMVLILWTIGMCFSWPSLEALVSEGESRRGLSRMIGIYNVVWSSGAAVAYFTGGAMLESLGRASLFWVPAACHLAQLALLAWLTRLANTRRLPQPCGIPLEEAALINAECGVRSAERRQRAAVPCATLDANGSTDCSTDLSEGHVHPAKCKAFLRMAWLANPFAYVAMNTLIPLLPDLALRLKLSTALAGFVGSVWMFARLAAFVGLWQWTGWHYRFRWLISAYALMIACFAIILLVPIVWVIIAAELVFGLAVGLIYYSSLFYSMDVGETKGEHGGFHEALIGLGIFLGPAVGASTLRLFPSTPQAGVWAVCGLLVLGLGILITLRQRKMA